MALVRVRCSRCPWNPFLSRSQMAAAACVGVVKVTNVNAFHSPVSWSIGKLLLVSGLNFPNSLPTSSKVVECSGL